MPGKSAELVQIANKFHLYHELKAMYSQICFELIQLGKEFHISIRYIYCSFIFTLCWLLPSLSLNTLALFFPDVFVPALTISFSVPFHFGVSIPAWTSTSVQGLHPIPLSIYFNHNWDAALGCVIWSQCYLQGRRDPKKKLNQNWKLCNQTTNEHTLKWEKEAQYIVYVLKARKPYTFYEVRNVYV